MDKKLIDEWLDEMAGAELNQAEYDYIVEFAKRWIRTKSFVVPHRTLDGRDVAKNA